MWDDPVFRLRVEEEVEKGIIIAPNTNKDLLQLFLHLFFTAKATFDKRGCNCK